MRFFKTLTHFVHRNFIWLVCGSYVVAACFPTLGLAIRSASIGGVSLPMIMLAALLFNAGVGVDVKALAHLRKEPLLLLLGLAGNVLIPLAFIGAVTMLMGLWHNPDEVQNILVGLALVASMPIAGSSTAWSQNANGNMTLSLGLVLGSTLLSPLLTPLVLHAVGFMTTGDYSQDLHELAGGQTGSFLLVAVILPSLLGIAFRQCVGTARATSFKSSLKLANSALLLVLNYSNASVSLPHAIANPDYDLLGVILVIVSGLCVIAFLAGYSIWRLRRSHKADKVALMFGLGMNNNGTGLVLASLALADHPRVLLPIIFYNLVQHLIAGIIDHLMFRKGEEETVALAEAS